jgi:hypothetical protein
MVAASEICALRLGYFSQRDPDSGYRSEDFLTGGISLSWGAGSISLSIQDSHLFHHQGMEPILGPNAPEFQETNISSGFSILF